MPRHFGLGGDDFVDNVADQSRPAGGFRQLRRSCPNMVKTPADTAALTHDPAESDPFAGTARFRRRGGQLGVG